MSFFNYTAVRLFIIITFFIAALVSFPPESFAVFTDDQPDGPVNFYYPARPPAHAFETVGTIENPSSAEDFFLFDGQDVPYGQHGLLCTDYALLNVLIAQHIISELPQNSPTFIALTIKIYFKEPIVVTINNQVYIWFSHVLPVLGMAEGEETAYQIFDPTGDGEVFTWSQPSNEQPELPASIAWPALQEAYGGTIASTLLFSGAVELTEQMPSLDDSQLEELIESIINQKLRICHPTVTCFQLPHANTVPDLMAGHNIPGIPTSNYQTTVENLMQEYQQAQSQLPMQEGAFVIRPTIRPINTTSNLQHALQEILNTPRPVGNHYIPILNPDSCRPPTFTPPYPYFNQLLYWNSRP